MSGSYCACTRCRVTVCLASRPLNVLPLNKQVGIGSTSAKIIYGDDPPRKWYIRCDDLQSRGVVFFGVKDYAGGASYAGAGNKCRFETCIQPGGGHQSREIGVGSMACSTGMKHEVAKE